MIGTIIVFFTIGLRVTHWIRDQLATDNFKGRTWKFSDDVIIAVESFVPPEKGAMFMRFGMKQIGSISKVFFLEKCPSEVFTFLQRPLP